MKLVRRGDCAGDNCSATALAPRLIDHAKASLVEFFSHVHFYVFSFFIDFILPTVGGEWKG
jgi:hypothetical protein